MQLMECILKMILKKQSHCLQSYKAFKKNGIHKSMSARYCIFAMTTNIQTRPRYIVECGREIGGRVV